MLGQMEEQRLTTTLVRHMLIHQFPILAALLLQSLNDLLVPRPPPLVFLGVQVLRDRPIAALWASFPRFVEAVSGVHGDSRSARTHSPKTRPSVTTDVHVVNTPNFFIAPHRLVNPTKCLERVVTPRQGLVASSEEIG